MTTAETGVLRSSRQVWVLAVVAVGNGAGWLHITLIAITDGASAVAVVLDRQSSA